MKNENIQQQLQESLGNMKNSMKGLQDQMQSLLANAKQELNEDELAILSEFEQSAVNLDIPSLEILRDKYTEKLKNGRK